MFEYVQDAGIAGSGAFDWHDCQQKIAQAFENLQRREILALGAAGQTQYDALSQVERRFEDLQSFLGACFYTREDGLRARDTGELRLALWAPQDDFDHSMQQIGRAVVEEFARVGLAIAWDGRSRSRPLVHLH